MIRVVVAFVACCFLSGFFAGADYLSLWLRLPLSVALGLLAVRLLTPLTRDKPKGD